MSKRVTLDFHCVKKGQLFKNYISIASSFAISERLQGQFENPQNTLKSSPRGDLQLMSPPLEIKLDAPKGGEVNVIMSCVRLDSSPETAGHFIQNIFRHIIQVCHNEQIQVGFSSKFKQNINFGLTKAANAAKAVMATMPEALAAAADSKKSQQTPQSIINTAFIRVSDDFETEIQRQQGSGPVSYQDLHGTEAEKIAMKSYDFADFFEFNLEALLALVAGSNKKTQPVSSVGGAATFRTPLVGGPGPGSQKMKNPASDESEDNTQTSEQSSGCCGCFR